MPLHLKRYQTQGHRHFITFSCHDRLPYLTAPPSRDLFLQSLERTRQSYLFQIFAYVVMPEHVHILLNEPPSKPLATAIQALKVSISKQSTRRPFWLPRYHDRNVFNRDTTVDIIHYIHRNPVTRGLVLRPEDWPWSSTPFYLQAHPSPVHLTPP